MIAAVIMALLMSGCIAAIQETEPGAAQPTVEELLADALKYYNAGNYEEAIPVSYTHLTLPTILRV